MLQFCIFFYTYLEPLKHNTVIMNCLNKQQQTQIIASLVEGNSLRATARICNVAFNTALKLVPEIGAVCSDYQNRAFRNLSCKLIQYDGICRSCM